ncbi:MAG TPA: PEP/pyruvate-binding domain-containing protein, partial [Candidatus Eisenbacteria bacterium]|nr:PEP/pyruvate-binding domain-containing protein [Candidatus Eisenbacteria bacterium]
AFIMENDLAGLAASDLPDRRIALEFQRGNLPAHILGDLHTLVEVARRPLAVRSSSLLEDALHHPFAGIYQTKMIPNNAPDAQTRFRRLTEAIKFVFASTYFQAARTYAQVAGRTTNEEKMAVIVQEVVGLDHGDRFYPNLSGVARSLNVYPHGAGRREDGVVALALGLGKTIVEGGATWAYSPAHPASPPPFRSLADQLDSSQTRFWAVNMGSVPSFDPIAETEFLVHADLEAAEYDGTLNWLASTYDAEADRLVPGTGRDGPRVLDFAPLLSVDAFPFNTLVRSLMRASESALGGPVEIEFAATLPQAKSPQPPRLGFLQVRPLFLGREPVEITGEEWNDSRALIVSEHVLGNGVNRQIQDVIYVKPDRFDPKVSPRVAEEIARLGRALFATQTPYLLMGFGRWGSTDPWLGIPVSWDQIAGAAAIVEGSLDVLDVAPSQGAHFFQNVTAFDVMYFSLDRTATAALDWRWLDEQPASEESAHVRHLRLPKPLTIKADGRTGRGGIWR